MARTWVTLGVANPAAPQTMAKVRFLLDSAFPFAVVPTELLRKLGIAALDGHSFDVGHGGVTKRRMGTALFSYRGCKAGAPVAFGEPGDANLVGVVTLAALGLQIHPLKRELRPLPMLLV